MLNRNSKSVCKVFVKFRYIGILIVLCYVIEIVAAISHFAEVADNLNGNKILKYGSQCLNCTRIKRTVDRILHRQKRYLVFPMGSAIVVTMAGVKGIIFSTPRGYNYLAEVDFYYPLPDKIYRLHHRTTTTTTEAPTTMPPEMLDHHYPDYHDHLSTGWDHDHHDEIFMPNGGWKDDIFKNINADNSPMEGVHMNAVNSSRRYWNENISYNNFRPPSLQPMSRRRMDFMKPEPVKSPVYYRDERKTEKSTYGGRNHWDWADSKLQRDRRDLYAHIESIFEYKGLHIRTCILRAICEARHFLLPKGKSLFHDIFRILFTIPTKSEMNDDYSNSIRDHDDDENCWKLYENDCPISILQLLLKSQKIV